ncbi:hypothetical protein [Sandarakinorhabdus sp. DWP1-3-1]|uniref:hypothetical protein n=1 Tax=Sandarakinorhabdus sp. DWP1-3-1 TaxID=2804627 RepID=UPI003CF94A6A
MGLLPGNAALAAELPVAAYGRLPSVSHIALAGGDVELVTLAAEDHWLSRGPTRVQMLEATVAFLEKHNPAK